MVSGQTGCKMGRVILLMVVATMWVTVALAEENEGFLEAVKRGDLPSVKVFVAKGADVNAKGNDGQTALRVASYSGRKEIVQVLLGNRADVNAKGNDGGTALMVASQQGHKDVVELLLAKGADVNAKGNGGGTALMAASQNGRNEVKELLLKAGAKQ